MLATVAGGWPPLGYDHLMRLVEPVQESRLGVRLVQVLVIVTVFSGFINLVPGPTAPATLLIDGITAVMFFGVLVTFIRRGGAEAWMVWTIIAGALALVLALFGPVPPGDAIIAVRSLLFYVAAAMFTAVTVRTRESALRIVRTVMKAGLAIAVLGCIQFVFRGALPQWLLFTADTKLFSYYGTDITRATGLVGNSIVYGTFVSLIFVLWLASSTREDLTRASRLRHLVAVAISGAAVVVSFSRISITVAVAAVAIAMLYAILRKGASRAVVTLFHIGLVGSILILVVLAIPQLLEPFSQTFLVQGLFLGNNASVTGSTDGHEMFTRLALQSFAEHPWVGIGLGSQSGANDRIIITDGFHLSTMVEGGLVLLVPVTLSLLLVWFRALGMWRRSSVTDRWLHIAVAVFLASQIFAAGFYNTGFYGKVPNVIFWIVFGAAVALFKAGSRELDPQAKKLELASVSA